MGITTQKNSTDLFPEHSVWERRKFRRSLKRRMPLGKGSPETLQEMFDVMGLTENEAFASTPSVSLEVLMRMSREKWGDGAPLSEGILCLFIRFCQVLLTAEEQRPEAFFDLASLKKVSKKTDSKKKKLGCTFTPRENTILKAMKKGLGNKEIALVLQISPFTVVTLP